MQKRCIPKNVIIYGAAISCMEKSNRVDIALQLFNGDDGKMSMTKDGIRPNAHIYNSIILACARGGMSERGYKIFRAMDKVGVKPDIVSFN